MSSHHNGSNSDLPKGDLWFSEIAIGSRLGNQSRIFDTIRWGLNLEMRVICFPKIWWIHFQQYCNVFIPEIKFLLQCAIFWLHFNIIDHFQSCLGAYSIETTMFCHRFSNVILDFLCQSSSLLRVSNLLLNFGNINNYWCIEQWATPTINYIIDPQRFIQHAENKYSTLHDM